MALPLHVHRDATRRREQVASDDVIGTEARWADLQHPVPGGEARSDPVAHEPMERARAWLRATMRAAPDAGRDAVGLESGHRPRADPAGCHGGADRITPGGRGPSWNVRDLHAASPARRRGRGRDGAGVVSAAFPFAPADRALLPGVAMTLRRHFRMSSTMVSRRTSRPRFCTTSSRRSTMSLRIAASSARSRSSIALRHACRVPWVWKISHPSNATESTT